MALHSKRQGVTQQTTTHLPTSRCSPTLSRWTRQRTRVHALLTTKMRSFYDRIRSPFTREWVTRNKRAVSCQLDKEKTSPSWVTHTSGPNLFRKKSERVGSSRISICCGVLLKVPMSQATLAILGYMKLSVADPKSQTTR